VKTSNIDALMSVRSRYGGAHANRGVPFRQRLAEADKKREMVFQGLSEGLGKLGIARKYHIDKNCVIRAYKALAVEGRLEWDPEKGTAGGWRVRE